MTETIDHVHAVARTVLARLGGPTSSWRVLTDEEYRDSGDLPPGTIGSREVLVGISLGTSLVGVHFALDAPADEAVAVMAGQIQDHVLQETRGAALPPCPGHRHPLDARSIDGVAAWACPQDPAHHSEPVLPWLGPSRGL
jgi:hypothetical protein